MNFKHFKTRETFNKTTLDPSDIAFIQNTGEIWTHNKFYGSGEVSKADIPTKLSQLTNDLYAGQEVSRHIFPGRANENIYHRVASFDLTKQYASIGDVFLIYMRQADIFGMFKFNAYTDLPNDTTKNNDYTISIDWIIRNKFALDSLQLAGVIGEHPEHFDLYFKDSGNYEADMQVSYNEVVIYRLTNFNQFHHIDFYSSNSFNSSDGEFYTSLEDAGNKLGYTYNSITLPNDSQENLNRETIDYLTNKVQEFTNFLSSTDAKDTTINKWKELESFLQGITDTQTLTGVIKDAIDNQGICLGKVKVDTSDLDLLFLPCDIIEWNATWELLISKPIDNYYILLNFFNVDLKVPVVTEVVDIDSSYGKIGVAIKQNIDTVWFYKSFYNKTPFLFYALLSSHNNIKNVQVLNLMYDLSKSMYNWYEIIEFCIGYKCNVASYAFALDYSTSKMTILKDAAPYKKGDTILWYYDQPIVQSNTPTTDKYGLIKLSSSADTDNKKYVKIEGDSIPYIEVPNASDSNNGLMSIDDKSKLNYLINSKPIHFTIHIKIRIEDDKSCTLVGIEDEAGHDFDNYLLQAINETIDGGIVIFDFRLVNDFDNSIISNFSHSVEVIQLKNTPKVYIHFDFYDTIAIDDTLYNVNIYSNNHNNCYESVDNIQASVEVIYDNSETDNLITSIKGTLVFSPDAGLSYNENNQLVIPGTVTNLGEDNSQYIELLIPEASNVGNGLLSKEDKIKLDSIEPEPNPEDVEVEANFVFDVEDLEQAYEPTNVMEYLEKYKYYSDIPINSKVRVQLRDNHYTILSDRIGAVASTSSTSTLKTITIVVDSDYYVITQQIDGNYGIVRVKSAGKLINYIQEVDNNLVCVGHVRSYIPDEESLTEEVVIPVSDYISQPEGDYNDQIHYLTYLGSRGYSRRIIFDVYDNDRLTYLKSTPFVTYTLSGSNLTITPRNLIDLNYLNNLQITDSHPISVHIENYSTNKKNQIDLSDRTTEVYWDEYIETKPSTDSDSDEDASDYDDGEIYGSYILISQLDYRPSSSMRVYVEVLSDGKQVITGNASYIDPAYNGILIENSSEIIQQIKNSLKTAYKTTIAMCVNYLYAGEIFESKNYSTIIYNKSNNVGNTQILTLEEYNNLIDKDSNTIYYIKD